MCLIYTTDLPDSDNPMCGQLILVMIKWFGFYQTSQHTFVDYNICLELYLSNRVLPNH